MTRHDLIKSIRAATGLSVAQVEEAWVAAVSPSADLSDLDPDERLAACLILRELSDRLRAEIRRLSAGNKRRNFPRSYRTEAAGSPEFSPAEKNPCAGRD